MLKKVFSILIIMVFVVGGSISFAETDEAYENDFYSITNEKVIFQDDNKVIINFEIVNNTDNYYPELFIAPRLNIEGPEELSMFVMPYHYYDPIEFSLMPNETKFMSINCELPNKMPNKESWICLDVYSITHRVSFSKGIFKLGRIANGFDGFIEGEIISLWQMNDGTYIRSDAGPNVDISDLPKVKLRLESTFNTKKKIYPQYIVYERSNVYNNTPIYSSIGEEIVFRSGEDKKVVLNVPAFEKPESYLIRVNFVDELGTPVSYTYDYRYVIKGTGAKVTKITLDNATGSNVVKGYIYGPADASTLIDATVIMNIYDINKLLIGQKEEKLTLGKEEIIISMPLEYANGSEVTAEIIVSYNNTELYRKEETLTLDIKSKDEPKFSDIIGKDCEEAVKVLNGFGIISGYPDNTFKPENLVTRAEFSTIITKLLELDIENIENVAFSDVNGHWAESYINTIYKEGFVSGYPDGTFKPQNNVTYAETVTILLNALGYKEEVNSSELNWPDNYITKSEEIGLVKGLNISAYTLPANRGDIAMLALNAYLLK